MYANVLSKSGLKSGEAEIYDALIQHGNLPASELTSKTKYKRGMVYKFLDDLKKKGLVSTFTKNKKTYFKAEHPYKLMQEIEGSIQQARVQQATLEAVLPQIISSFSAMENEPGVRVYEGIEGIKEVYMDTLRDKNEIWAILQTAEVEPSLYKWLNEFYAPERKKEGIHAKVIASQDSRVEEYAEKELRETRVVSKKRFPVSIEMDIYGNKVAFINFKKGAAYVGIIINNSLVATSMKALFTLAWEGMEPQKKE